MQKWDDEQFKQKRLPLIFLKSCTRLLVNSMKNANFIQISPAFRRQGFASEQLPQRCLMFCFSCKIAIHQLLKWVWVKTVLATTTSPCIWARAVFTLGWEIGQNAWNSNRSYHCQGYSLTAVCILGVMANILTCLVLARYRVSSLEDRP